MNFGLVFKLSFYNFTGHSSMIGPNTDKVIDFDYRTRLCSICTHHFSRRETVPAHVCNSNWEG